MKVDVEPVASTVEDQVMKSDSYIELELTVSQSRTLGERLGCIDASPLQDFEIFRKQVVEIMTLAAPTDLTQLLGILRSRSSRTSIVLLKNAPLPQALPPTPTEETTAAFSYNPVSTGFLVGCGVALGCIYA